MAKFVESIVAKSCPLNQIGVVGFVVWECKNSIHEWYTITETVYSGGVCRLIRW